MIKAFIKRFQVNYIFLKQASNNCIELMCCSANFENNWFSNIHECYNYAMNYGRNRLLISKPRNYDYNNEIINQDIGFTNHLQNLGSKPEFSTPKDAQNIIENTQELVPNQKIESGTPPPEMGKSNH